MENLNLKIISFAGYQNKKFVMKLIIAKNIGFCSGVKRAIMIAEKSLKEDVKPIQLLGSLVHNENVIEKFRKKGIKFIIKPEQTKLGTLIIQAHGFPPFKLSKKILIRDATCPLVRKVQTLAKLLHKKGYKIIIIGDKDHSETKGINGYVKNKAIIIENKAQIKKLKKIKKIGLVVQTTQDLDKFLKIVEILKNKFKKIKWFNTICPEVIARQKELDKILKICDGILVIGSRSSANTKRLVEKAKKLNKKVFWVNSLKELKNKKLKKVFTLGVVSGTSTPNWEVKKITQWLKKIK